ncbi:GpE family phage tail protein [Acinetobacter schindleri]|nr:GpE family phage tail protein [Acinetobacter schindleri]
MFHWPPCTYDAMSYLELCKWHQLALRRNQTSV